MTSWGVILLLVFLAAISSEAMGQKGSKAVSTGRWGGTGVEFVVEKDSVTITYDCAVGEIRRQLRTDSAGKFIIEGIHKRLYPGALRTNLQPIPVSALYKGKLTKKKIRYRALLTETGEVIGEFTVELGKEARIRGCR